MLNDEQRFLFDTLGYIIVPDLLSSEQVEALQSTLRISDENSASVSQDEDPLHWGKSGGIYWICQTLARFLKI
jgi:hypothetical protein